MDGFVAVLIIGGIAYLVWRVLEDTRQQQLEDNKRAKPPTIASERPGPVIVEEEPGSPYSATALRKRSEEIRQAKIAEANRIRVAEEARAREKAARQDAEATAHVTQTIAAAMVGVAEKLPHAMMSAAEKESNVYSTRIIQAQETRYWGGGTTEFNYDPPGRSSSPVDPLFYHWRGRGGGDLTDADAEAVAKLASTMPEFQKIAAVCRQYGYSMKFDAYVDEIRLIISY